MLTNSAALRCILETVSSEYTAFTHSLNGTYLSIALAQRVGIVHPVELRHLAFGALLRDIGMTQIDAEIIEKRGRLDMNEFRQIKQHPILGDKMARNYAIIGDIERRIIRQHHERLDGSGYPDGLAGDDISPLVRIVSIADVFNALTTERPFQPRMKTFDALKYMSANMKQEVDSHVFSAFVEMMGKAR
jgi:HD-GYP domain-containing protein (c-di-GMP phosphodiesterase class II)